MVIALLAASLTLAKTSLPWVGGDPSEIPEVEARGAVYKVEGKAVDPWKAMKAAGWTAVRLRVWNDPKDGFCDKAHTLEAAKRIKAAGLKLMIDFHYSDWWADPGKQNKPAKWKDLDFDGLKKAVHDYSLEVVKALHDQGTPADVVQPGNEVTNGMLWPDGRLNPNTDGWDKFMDLTKAALAGIHEGAGNYQPKIMCHIDQGGRNYVSRWFFDQYFERGGEADIIGLSYYPMWHGTMDMLKANLADLSKRYKRDVMVAETAFPSLGWDPKTRKMSEDATPVPDLKANKEGQREFLVRLTKIVESVPGHRGVGVLWWAPAWISAPGQQGGWSHLTLFDNATGEANPAFFVWKR